MGASSSSSSKSPPWYPGEPSADVLLGHEDYHGDAPSQSSPLKGGGDGSQFSITTAEGKRAVGGAAPTTTTTTTTALPSPSSTSTAAREPAVERVGVANSPSNPSSANREKADLNAEANRAGRDINTLPVVELAGLKFIAKGAFCAVFACKYRGLSVVAKRVREDLPLPARRAALANLWEEFECLRPLYHPNVIEAYGLCRVRCREGYDDWNEKDVCLLLEELALGTVGHLFGTINTVEKNLASAMARSRRMKMVPFRCRLDRILELALALQYVHGGSGKGVMMHRDIKSVNVGFAQNGSLKLMDFGLSKMAPPGTTEDDTYKMTGEVGSYRYMAPELVKHQPYNVKVDIYSWAILSWEILAIDKPYSWATETTFVARVINGGERPQLRKSWPDRLCRLLESAWHADHAERPTAAKLVAELVAVKAELPAKYRRQRPIVIAPTPVGGAGGGGGGSSGSSSRNRRHSWTPQASSSLFDTDGRTRPLSGAAHDHGPTTTAVPQLQPAKSLPLPLTSSSSSFSSEKTRRWSLTSAKRPSWLGKSAPSVAEEGGGGGGGTRRPESVAEARRGRRGGASGSSAAESVVNENDNETQQDRRRGSGRAGEAGRAQETTTTGDDSGRRQPLNRRRNSRQREIIMDALAREGAAGAEAPPVGQRKTSKGEGGQTTGQRRRNGGAASEEGNTRADEAEVGETAAKEHDDDAAATGKQKPQQARRPDRRVSSTPQGGPSREDSETSARARCMPAQRLVAATRKDLVGTRSCEDNKFNEQNEPAERGAAVAMIGTNEEEEGGTAGVRTREKREDALLLPSSGRTSLLEGRTSLLNTAVIEEEADEENDEDASGRSRRNSSIDKLWPALPLRSEWKDVPQQAPFRTGPVRAAPKPKGKAAPTAVRAGGVASEEEVNIFAMLGTPGSAGSADAIEGRLALLTGTLSMPRAIS